MNIFFIILPFISINLIKCQNYRLAGCSCLNESTLFSLICTKKFNSSCFPSLNNSSFTSTKNISIKLTNQNFSILPELIFENLNLISLDLSNCQIETIHVNSFKGVVQLETLNLANNKLKETRNVFKSLINLKTLILDT